MTGYHEQQGALTARILAHVDLTDMTITDRIDLMTAISELAALTLSAQSPDVVQPATIVRHPSCVPETHGVCAAAVLEVGLSHCCCGDQGHDGSQHQCRCGHAWDEVVAQHVDGACGLTRQVDSGEHECVCRLEVHNLVQGADMIDRPLHACVHCGGSWAA